MIIKASGRSALILAAGLCVLLASPVWGAPDGDDAATEQRSENPAAAPATHRAFRHASHHRRSYAHRRSHAIAAKADTDDKKPAVTEAATADNKVLPQIPPAVANANAQMLLAGAQMSAVAAIPSGTDVPTTASNPASANSGNDTVLVAADQLNDVDKALHESNPPPPAANPPPAAAPAAAAAATSENSVWDQTSLIGKIFIGFGALLTMASAARMFIA
jgi:hypothetical protein